MRNVASPQIRRLIVVAGIAIAVLAASRGLLSAIGHKALMSGHDTTSYALWLTEFHDNVSNGNLVPIWAQHLRYGHGEPHLMFRPPLQLYLSELFYLLTGNLFVAINLTCILFLAAAGAGMYRLFSRILGSIRPDHDGWPPLVVAIGYVVSPYVLTDIYVRGAFSESTCFPVFPWLALAFIELARKPDAIRIALAALAYACLAMSHAAIHLFTAPFVVLTALVYRRHIKSPGRFIAAIVLGAAASCFYSASALLEKNLVKSALLAVDFEAYVQHFKRLDELLYSPLRFTQSEALSFSLGVLIWIGIGWAIWSWAARKQRGELGRLALVLLGYSATCIYFIHRISAFWYEAFPLLQVMTFPWRFLTILTFFGTLLGGLALATMLRARWQWIAVGAILVIVGFIEARPVRMDNYKPDDFSGPAIAAGGWGWLKPYTTPTTAGILPTKIAPAPVEIIEGRGELKCTRHSPTRMQCGVRAAEPSLLRFNTLDYPGWKVFIDGMPAASTTNALTGVIEVRVTSGAHDVRWEFRNPKSRTAVRGVAALAWLSIIGLLVVGRLRRKTKD